jgi:hypothetical protein
MVACQPPLLDAEDARDALTVLHPRVYDVYAPELSDDAVHGILSEVFDGEALTEEYLTHHVNRAQMRTRDIRVSVHEVEHGASEIVEVTSDAVRVALTWWVRGLVHHQAHTHARVNQYQAIYTLALRDVGWRVVGVRMQDLQRIRGELSEAAMFGDPEADGGGSKGFVDPLDVLELLEGADE